MQPPPDTLDRNGIAGMNRILACREAQCNLQVHFAYLQPILYCSTDISGNPRSFSTSFVATNPSVVDSTSVPSTSQTTAEADRMKVLMFRCCEVRGDTLPAFGPSVLPLTAINGSSSSGSSGALRTDVSGCMNRTDLVAECYSPVLPISLLHPDAPDNPVDPIHGWIPDLRHSSIFLHGE
eukprot:6179786-Pleurochrysis_carterae.AAC.7